MMLPPDNGKKWLQENIIFCTMKKQNTKCFAGDQYIVTKKKETVLERKCKKIKLTKVAKEV